MMYQCLKNLVWIIVFQEVFTMKVHRKNQNPLKDFNRKSTKPRIYHREVATTKEGDFHIKEITIALTIDKNDFLLDLILNKELIPEGYFIKTADNTHKPSPQQLNLCHYKGHVRGRSNSWIALSTCNNVLSGMIFDGEQMHYLERNDNINHLLHTESESFKQNQTELIPQNFKQTNQIKEPLFPSRYIELILVVDSLVFKILGESIPIIETHCGTIANFINGLYTSLNISIVLVGVVIWTQENEIDFSKNKTVVLEEFANYTQIKLQKEHPHDNAQLLTLYQFENDVGLAKVGNICENSVGMTKYYTRKTRLLALTMAHEIGHNLGMSHDDLKSCLCQHCIMEAITNIENAPSTWSSCSMNTIELLLKDGKDYCLRNKPMSLFDPSCGNGIVEVGEECDCGSSICISCCDTKTCKLHTNITCTRGECCDLNTCQLKSDSTLCRSSVGECDLPENCTGKSEYCPFDAYKMNTECDIEGFICMDQKCVPKNDSCSEKCNNNGVCNNFGFCDCKVGFIPPYCEVSISRKSNNVFERVFSFVFVLMILLIGIFQFHSESRKKKVNSNTQ